MPSGISVEPVAPQRILHGTAAKEFSKPAYVNSSGVGGQPILIPSPKTPQKKEGCVCVCVCLQGCHRTESKCFLAVPQGWCVSGDSDYGTQPTLLLWKPEH